MAVVLGAIFISRSFIINKAIDFQSNKTLKQLDDLTFDTIKNNMLMTAEFNFDCVVDIGAMSLYNDFKNIDNKYIIGQIVINDIGLNLPILKGISNSNLAVGAATLKEGQRMGEGNFALAGHYNKNKYILFGGLMYLKKGSLILITDKNYVYEYAVCDTKIAYDTDTYMISDLLASQKGKPIITLMTCYYSSKTGKRYFVIGEFIRKYPYSGKI